MGLSLFNKRICNTYPGVIKTCDNAALTVTPKPMTDGVGNDVPINIGTSTICYGGTQDFTGATVIGISGSTAGLVPGAGTSSMVSDIGITAVALQSCSISIGNAAYNCCERSINIGDGSTGLNSCTIGIGFATSNTGVNSIALGNNSVGTGTCSISIGQGAQSGAADSIGIGRSSNARCLNSISIGALSDVLSSNTTAVGVSTCIGPSSNSSSVFGQAASVFSASSLAMGLATCVGTNSPNSITIGCGSVVFANSCCSTVIGKNSTSCCIENIIIGNTSCSINECGITVGHSSINDGGNSIAIGNCVQVSSDVIVPFPANVGQIAIGMCSSVNEPDAISIGRCSCVCTTPPGFIAGSMAIGKGANVYTTTGPGISIGMDSKSCNGATVLGHAAWGTGINSTSISGYSVGQSSINIGGTPVVYGSFGDSSIAIGINSSTCVGANCSIVIGGNSFVCTGVTHAVAIGRSAIAAGFASVSLGCAQSCSSYNISIGLLAKSHCLHGQAYGCLAQACEYGAIAMGRGVVASRCNTLTTKELETCIAGCGLIVKTPDGLNSYRIAVDNSGNITTALA
jgi:hypothetical protein